MTKAQEIESYLIKNNIRYIKGSGCLCVNINAIPNDVFKKYHKFMYNIEKKYRAK